MSGIEDGNPEPAKEAMDRNSVSLCNPGTQESEDALSGLEVQTHRFLNLSSEIVQILSDLSQKTKLAYTQLQGLQAEIEQKKQDLKILYEIEVSAAPLSRLAEEHRAQKENLERLIANQQALWEEEKDRLAREERAYWENLGVIRRQEDEEFQRLRQREQLAATQKFEEELRILQQKEADRMAVLGQDLSEREQILREKEQDAVRLIQELERFMRKLEHRDKSQGTASPDLDVRTNPSAADSFVSGFHSPEEEFVSQESAPILTSVNEMLLSLNKKKEDLKDDFSPKMDPAFLQFSPKKSLTKSEENENSDQP